MKGLWKKVRRVWATLGTLAFVGFTAWALVAYRAQSGARAALQSNDRVSVTRGEGYWSFRPRQSAEVGLVFFAGALVEPAAYAPLAQAVADSSLQRAWCASMAGITPSSVTTAFNRATGRPRSPARRNSV